MKNKYQPDSESIRNELAKSKVVEHNVTHELKNSFMEYSMSVIISRALPDVRDGLKPVHRRILYAAFKEGIDHDKPYCKSAKLVGAVLGGYHPHGDSAVYETIVRMAQDFSLRYMLIDGHGNFGSVDGDNAAAARYTEVRLSKIASELLANIEKETVDFTNNYDNTKLEPTVLPASLPNLLMNGASGIAVGMATNIPPHNLAEVIDALIHLAHNETVTIAELTHFIKGPDFPTAAEIIGTKGIEEYFHTGRGSVTIRSKSTIEAIDNDKYQICVHEIPYQVNKRSLIEKIVELIDQGKITGIDDLRDESSRKGIRLIIETKRNVIPEVLLNNLYKMTALQSVFSVNMLTLVNGEPRLLNLKEVLSYYLDHLYQVLLRKTQFELVKAEQRLHIVECFIKITDDIEQAIKIIKNNRETETIIAQLRDYFALSELQAKTILEMRLGQISGLQREKFELEVQELRANITKFKEILTCKSKQVETICANLTALKTKYHDQRRTVINAAASPNIANENLIPVESVIISLSHKNYLKRMALEVYKNQHRGGKGVIGVRTYEDDDVKLIISTKTHADLLFFTNHSKVYRLRAHEIPNCSKEAKGTPAVNVISIQKDEYIKTILVVDDYEQGSLLFATKKGYLKMTKVAEYKNIRKNGKIALKLNPDDELLSVILVKPQEEIFLSSSNNKIVRFKAESMRSLSRNAVGVRGIKLLANESLVSISSVNNGPYLLCIGSNGNGKITEADKFRLTKRNSKGVIALKNTEKTGELVFSENIFGDEEVIVLTKKGKIIRLSLAELPILSRNTQGLRVINLETHDKVIGATVLRLKVLDETELLTPK